MTLDLAHLLRRPPIHGDPAALRASVEGRRVLVTGAGGSIGSELCRQIVQYEPAALVMLDRHENSLNDVYLSIQPSRAQPFLGDVLDVTRLDRLFARLEPEIVFHAAAHKHVPLVEIHAAEAVRNNVGGTRAVASAAGRHGVQRFVLVSSDKAVNPSSVMGATKRVAELLLHEIAPRWPGTALVSVRFGNVLGSNGSVVPRFLDQIRAGGPITITHPGVRRYFMLIPEAVQLLIQAAAIGRSGDVYVLEMGEAVNITDLAERIMGLTGARVPVTYIGLRSGEKLDEELVGDGEWAEATSVPHVRHIRSNGGRAAGMAESIESLERIAATDDNDAVIAALRAIIPAFTPTPGVDRNSGVPA